MYSRDRRADPQAKSSRPDLGEFGLDPMIHLKSDHFLDKSKTSYDPDSTESLKIYVFVKYIGEGIADSEILQLGYISEEDDKPNLIAVEPQDLDDELMKQLRYEKSSGKMYYRDKDGGMQIIKKLGRTNF